MKLKIRRVGNSLGVLLPKDVLLGWGLGEGDSLELSLNGIRPETKASRRKQETDEAGRAIGLAVIRQFTVREIRAQVRAALSERRRQGDWDEVGDYWQLLARGKEDGALFAAMLGRDEHTIGMRRWLPYVELLPAAQLRALREGTAGLGVP
jgi:antitoxin component of MazEF toxin-antitoxin module